MIVRRYPTTSNQKSNNSRYSSRYRVKDNEDIQKKLNANNKRRVYTKKQIQRFTAKTGSNIARKGIFEVRDVSSHSVPYVDDNQDADNGQEMDSPLSVHGQAVGSGLQRAVHSGRKFASQVQAKKNTPENVQPAQNEGLKKQLQVKRFVAQYPGQYKTWYQQTHSFHTVERISPEKEHFRAANRANHSTDPHVRQISKLHSEQRYNQQSHMQGTLQAKLIADKKSNISNVASQSSDMPRTDLTAYSQRPRISILRNDLRRKRTDNHAVEAGETGMQSVEKMKQYQQLTFQQRLIGRRIRKQADQQRKQSLHRPADVLGQVLKRQLAEATGRTALFTGGILMLVMMMFLCMVAGLAASPFGILFSGHVAEEGTMPLSQAIATANQVFSEELDRLQYDPQYVEVHINGNTADWLEVVALFSVKLAGGVNDAVDVVTIDVDKQQELIHIFRDMNKIDTKVDIFVSEDEEGNAIEEKILTVTITPYSANDMMSKYHFSERQKKAVAELLEQRNLLQELIGSMGVISADAERIRNSLPDNLPEERKAIVEAACSLVGKVNYFWGGKWPHKGWCSEWGTLKQVSAAGSPTTGTYRAYGLDCSGFVDWVFYNATNETVLLGQGGGVTAQHQQCLPISWEDALPGDLVFYADNSHIGIVAGRDSSGNLVIIQCASGANNVIISGIGSFADIGRPLVYGQK